MVKHGFLVLTADSTEVAEKPTTVGHHFRKGDFLQTHRHNLQGCYTKITHQLSPHYKCHIVLKVLLSLYLFI